MFTPSIALVIEGGCVLDVIVQDWPKGLSLPKFAVVDYDIEGTEDEITRVSVCDDQNEARCYSVAVDVFESFRPGALSPRALLGTLAQQNTGEASP
jgi:hypothetical protein